MTRLYSDLSDAEQAAWGNRAEFFSTIPPHLRPELDWRSVLSSRLAHASARWSQGYEELVIRDYFGDKKKGVFIDIGCAWPLKGSTSCFLECELGWTGLAVDALPDYHAGWKDKRKNSRFLNFAVSDCSLEEVTFYRHDWTGVSSLASLQAAKFGGDEKLTPITVKQITLNEILSKNDIQKIDHLTLDIEGEELNALNGFDIQSYAPQLCCIETATDQVAEYFNCHGYQLLDKYRKVDKINWYFSPK